MSTPTIGVFNWNNAVEKLTDPRVSFNHLNVTVRRLPNTANAYIITLNAQSNIPAALLLFVIELDYKELPEHIKHSRKNQCEYHRDRHILYEELES